MGGAALGVRRATGGAALGALLALALGACAPGAATPTKPQAPATPQAAAASGAPAATEAAPAASAPSRPAQIETIKVAFAADAAIYGPYFIAMDKGYFAEEGLEIEIVKAGGGVSTPALVSGELQYSTSATSVVSAAIQGAAVKVILTSADRAPYQMWSSTLDVRTLADLAGKPVGVQARGDTFEIATRLLLHKYGLDPNAVIYAAIGTGSQRLVAMQTASVAAMGIDVATLHQLKAGDFQGNFLADIQQEVRMPYQGAATTDQEIREHRNRAKRFLQATLKGRAYFKTFRDSSIDVLVKYNQAPRDANEADYDDVLPTLTEDGTAPLEDARADAALRASLNGIEQVPPVEQMYDYSLVREEYQELQARGWKPTR
jgi:ABC-type nitrate/sulfonate/bicarbonate transport system substrate-binding protein